MKVLIFLVLIVLATNASALFNSPAVRSLLFRQLSLTCKCVDRSVYCEFFSKRCTTSFTMRYMCPVTCGVCTACPPDPPAPTLIAPVSPCEFKCVDNWSVSICEYYKNEGHCKFFKSNCRATCGECRQCVLPPTKLDPCKEDCKDLRGEKDCTFWRGRSFCRRPDVRFVCQKTCGACTACPATPAGKR